MLKKTFISLLCAINLVPVCAQSWDEIERNSNTYIFGDGWGATVEEADQQALAALISKISIVVNSDFSITEDEKSVNGVLEASSYTNSKIQTYSAATLTNTERIVINNNADEAHIGRFLKRSELNRIFEGRVRTIKEYIRLGKRAEEMGKIDDALRNYYWAYTLLKTIQRPAELVYVDEETGAELHPLTWLPENMNNIFDNLDIKITNNDGANVDLMVTYKGSPVSNIDYTYFDGRDWSNISSVKNGIGTMEFKRGMIPSNIQIKYEYEYRGQSHINHEINSVLSVVKGKSLRKARVSLSTDNKENTKNNTDIQINTKTQSVSLSPVVNEKPYRETLNKVISAIKNNSYNTVLNYFTDDGKDMYTRLIEYGKARVMNTSDCIFYQFGENIVARSIQMSFSFKRGVRKNFVEDVVFTFNNEGKIDCIAFGLDAQARTDIMNRNVWSIEARQKIMEFLENYKTAYALKRIDYLRSIFDDDAVIIVGHVSHRLEAVHPHSDSSISYKNNTIIKRIQYTKEQYLKNLEACFRSNEFVNIRFANNDVRKAKYGDEYGIQIKQDYYSTNYGDQGYLYIQVDLNDRKEPIIRVRTWQSEPDPEIGLFGLGTF